ncbi:MAG: hypothetical protein Q8O13_05150 [Candidatus Omnitrophota bacterium]|nr:hypothetical protein [Candidatus Omnitrophota bacterium]
MKKRFSFLKDSRALAEIRKHKWIESEKRGQEIGFATAAVDWIKKYGEAWKKVYLKEDKEHDLFIEKRRYRRFPLNLGLVIKKDQICLTAVPNDINLEAISCKIVENLPTDTPVEIIFKHKDSVNYANSIRCNARILRVSPYHKHGLLNQEYNLVLIPGEACRNSLKEILTQNYVSSITN